MRTDTCIQITSKASPFVRTGIAGTCLPPGDTWWFLCCCER